MRSTGAGRAAEDRLTCAAAEAANGHLWYYRLTRPFYLLWDACADYMHVMWMEKLAQTLGWLQTAKQFYVTWKILLQVASAMQWSKSSCRKIADALGDVCGVHVELEERELEGRAFERLKRQTREKCTVLYRRRALVV